MTNFALMPAIISDAGFKRMLTGNLHSLLERFFTYVDSVGRQNSFFSGQNRKLTVAPPPLVSVITTMPLWRVAIWRAKVRPTPLP